MKIKVEKLKFDKFFRRFSTKGKLDRNKNEKIQMPIAYIEASGGIIKVCGGKKNQKLMCRGVLEGSIVEEGEFHITNLESFLKELKGLKGKHYEFEFSKSSVRVESGGKWFEFPFTVTPHEAVQLQKVLTWDKNHKFTKGILNLNTGGKDYPFDKWFQLKDPSPLNGLGSDLFDRVKSSTFLLKTGDTILISSDNKTDKRSMGTTEIEGEVFKKQEFMLGEVYPVFNSLTGESVVYSRITTKGSIILWFVNGNLEWQVTYKGK